MITLRRLAIVILSMLLVPIAFLISFNILFNYTIPINFESIISFWVLLFCLRICIYGPSNQPIIVGLHSNKNNIGQKEENE